MVVKNWVYKKNKIKKNVQLMLLPGFDNYLFGFLDDRCVLHSLPAEHAGEFKGCPLLDRIANYIDFFNAF